MFPHYPAVFIFTSLRSVTLGLPWRSLWLQVWAHLWCNRGWIMPTPLCMECQHLTCTNYSLPKILSLVCFCLLFAIFQQVSDPVTSWLPVNYRIQFKIATLTYKTLATCQPSYLYISFKYTTHHELSVLQPNNFSMYHICLLILVGERLATALLQHELHSYLH